MHCTDEGQEAENGHTAENRHRAEKQGGQRPEKRVTAPPTAKVCTMYNGTKPEKGARRPKRGKQQRAATAILEAPNDRSATQPTLPRRKSCMSVKGLQAPRAGDQA